MNQTHQLSPEIAEAIQSILEYLWEAEQADYQERPQSNHIFLALQTLAEAIQRSD